MLEGPWREGRSEFYHGLILYASAFVHVQRNNAHGIQAQCRKAERVLAPYEPHYLGIDVEAVRREARRLRRRMDHEGGGSGPWKERIALPRLKLDVEKVRGDEPELG